MVTLRRPKGPPVCPLPDTLCFCPLWTVVQCPISPGSSGSVTPASTGLLLCPSVRGCEESGANWAAALTSRLVKSPLCLQVEASLPWELGWAEAGGAPGHGDYGGGREGAPLPFPAPCGEPRRWLLEKSVADTRADTPRTSVSGACRDPSLVVQTQKLRGGGEALRP